MNRSVIQALILKDWELQRTSILISLMAGLVALAVIQLKSETALILGTIWFFVSLMVFGSMLPSTNVVNERKKQTLAFLMSLPVTAVQYSIAKIVSTVGMFLIPWGALVIAGLTFILSHRDIPRGIIPLMIVLAGMTFIGFSVMAAVALVTETEGWSIAASVVCNSSYSIAWYFVIRNPGVNGDLKSPTAVWNPTMLRLLAGEFAVIAIVLGITFYLQSRKRDFV
jgi:ABC-2 type transport system permease protein